ncbi:hypothetical protein BGZ57DRAFT_880059 [Hyaloscypha finlandica]|nr:hypothetical protein BGZ57DRAFT_880059 [Hyaloscypha finlandica]
MSTGCPETALTTMLLLRIYATTLEMMHEYGPDAAQNSHMRLIQGGYIITAYRTPNTAMIADLKADTERLEAEPRAVVSRGQPSNLEYRASKTH